jgi:hypothetical protein
VPVAQKTLVSNDLRVNIKLSAQKMAKHAVEGKIQRVAERKPPRDAQDGAVEEHHEGEQCPLETAIVAIDNASESRNSLAKCDWADIAGVALRLRNFVARCVPAFRTLGHGGIVSASPIDRFSHCSAANER